MSHATIHEEERNSGACPRPRLQPAAWDLSELWRLPFALMLMLFRAFFRRKLDWLREQRRTRPQPKNWREHYDQLRLAEWSVIEVSEAGLAQLLSGPAALGQGPQP